MRSPIGLRARAVAGRRHCASVRASILAIRSRWVASARRNASGADSAGLGLVRGAVHGRRPLGPQLLLERRPVALAPMRRARRSRTPPTWRGGRSDPSGDQSPPPRPGRVRARRGSASIRARTVASLGPGSRSPGGAWGLRFGSAMRRRLARRPRPARATDRAPRVHRASGRGRSARIARSATASQRGRNRAAYTYSCTACATSRGRSSRPSNSARGRGSRARSSTHRGARRACARSTAPRLPSRPGRRACASLPR